MGIENLSRDGVSTRLVEIQISINLVKIMWIFPKI